MAVFDYTRLKINPSLCKGCNICIVFCPKNALELVEGKAELTKKDDCILCGLCEQRCPDYAIYIEDAKGDKKHE